MSINSFVLNDFNENYMSETEKSKKDFFSIEMSILINQTKGTNA